MPEIPDTDVIDSANCSTMQEVRAGVDAVDAALVELLGRRFGFMDAAARIKSERKAVRDEKRKQDVLANVTREASVHNVSPELVRELWEQLIEASIAYEFDQWDALRS